VTTADAGAVRLTQFARGGGCACKIPPGELEETIAKLAPAGAGTDLLVGVENGDDGAVVRTGASTAVVLTGRRRRLHVRPDRRGQRAVGRVRDGRPPAGRGEPARLAA
jgi:hypothetical protein